MGYVRKTLRREHETPKRARFRCLVEQGMPRAAAARIINVNRTTALKWLNQPSDRRPQTRTGRPYIIPDEKVEEIIKWMTGYFDRRAMPFRQIADIFDIKANDNTILRALARFGYHHHIPDCKPFLSEATKRKRWTFLITNWD